MLRHYVECPHCGNETEVKDVKDVQKCRWCRRLISAKFERRGKKKYRCTVEPVDFPESDFEANTFKKHFF